MSEIDAESFLRKADYEWVNDDMYRNGNVLRVTPDLMMYFLDDFTTVHHLLRYDSFRGGISKVQPTFPPELSPRIDFQHLHSFLSANVKDEAYSHWQGIQAAGDKISETEEYRFTTANMFVWGYNLCYGILDITSPADRPTFEIYEARDSAHVEEEWEESVKTLMKVAREAVPVIVTGVDGLLDNLVAEHESKGFIDDSEHRSPFRDIERNAIRQRRLEVMLAGVGLAYMHWKEAVDNIPQVTELNLQDEARRVSKVKGVWYRLGSLAYGLLYGK